MTKTKRTTTEAQCIYLTSMVNNKQGHHKQCMNAWWRHQQLMKPATLSKEKHSGKLTDKKGFFLFLCHILMTMLMMLHFKL